MSDATARHLYPPPAFHLPAAEVRLVQEEFVRGRQFGIDRARFGRPYAFARYSAEAMWVIWAGPFEDDAAAEAWIKKL